MYVGWRDLCAKCIHSFTSFCFPHRFNVNGSEDVGYVGIWIGLVTRSCRYGDSKHIVQFCKEIQSSNTCMWGWRDLCANNLPKHTRKGHSWMWSKKPNVCSKWVTACVGEGHEIEVATVGDVGLRGPRVVWNGQEWTDSGFEHECKSSESGSCSRGERGRSVPVAGGGLQRCGREEESPKWWNWGWWWRGTALVGCCRARGAQQTASGRGKLNYCRWLQSNHQLLVPVSITLQKLTSHFTNRLDNFYGIDQKS